ncbi:MAG: alpha/beta fold hydrolase [Ilumatobacter sp.]
MTSASKRSLRWLAATTTFVLTAAACSVGSDDADTGTRPDSTTAATLADEPPATTVTPPAEPATTAPSAEPAGEAPPRTDAPTTIAAPEAAGIDIASFEQFALPDYAAAALDDGYSSYLVEVEPGVNVHVLEVGSGYPVYLQHGAPTSGFLYRKIAELLPPNQLRVIMPTMVGLGFSSQVPAEQHTLDNHVRWMNEALTQLDLDELIYVGHDWGGPVGLGALERSPELLAGAVLLNTALGAPTEPVELNPQLQALLTPLPADAELALSVAIFDQLPGAQNDPDSLSPDVLDLYRRPVAESDNPIGPLSILRMAATGPEHPTAEVLRAIDAYVAQLDIPAEIVWGVNDPLLGTRLDGMRAAFPNAPVTETDSGHFLQEEVDSPEAIAAAIQRIREQVSA